MKTNVFLGAIVVVFCAIARAEDKEAENETGETKLKVEVLVEPPEDCKLKSEVGSILKMNYVGTLAADGTEFDSSYNRDKPFFFTVGVGEVIKGWDQGLLNMCVGEKRKLTIPPELGYGENGAVDTIPGGATLIFEVELLEIRDGMNPTNVFKDIDKDGDELLSQDEVSDYIRSQETESGIDPLSDMQHNEMVADIFKHEDKDKDGSISHEEFSGPKHDEL